MRVLMILLPTAALFLAACDTASAPAGQEQETTTNSGEVTVPAQTDGGKPADIELKGAGGSSATLSYANAERAAPDVVFTGADGRDVELSDFAGRPLLVNIWATWCGPCKAEMPDLDALAARSEGKLSVIAISQDLEGRKAVQPYFQSAKLTNLEPYVDPDNKLLSALGTNVTLPTTILYDSQGKEVWRTVGAAHWNEADMTARIAEAD